MPEADGRRPLRILIVEDDAMIGMLLGEMLEFMGHSVCAIETTESAAVAAALLHKPDLMIVDALLYEGSGVAAVATINRKLADQTGPNQLGATRRGPIPCVFVSGDITEVTDIDPNAIVVAKPYNEAGLVRAMTRARSAVVRAQSA